MTKDESKRRVPDHERATWHVKDPDRPPLVSVVVPARNEELTLGTCLSSLVGQDGVSYEIIVVDDGSSDRTRNIAESFSAVRVIAAGDLPAGWGGKVNACRAGANAARGELLLFTDADTIHHPGSLARAVEEMRAAKADLLSYSPEQEVGSLVERVLMPLIFAELACAYKPKEVSDPSSPAAAANGQYLLVTRSAYDSVGGHVAFAGDLLEDVALARATKNAGYRLLFRYGGGLVRTRMYRSWPQMREGWTKNLALLFPDSGRLARRRLLEFAASVGALAVAAISAACGAYPVAGLAVLIAAPT